MGKYWYNLVFIRAIRTNNLGKLIVNIEHILYGYKKKLILSHYNLFVMKKWLLILFFIPCFAMAQQQKSLADVISTITTSFKNDAEVLKAHIGSTTVNSKYNKTAGLKEITLKVMGTVESFVDVNDPNITTFYWFFGDAETDKGVLKTKYQALKKELDAAMKKLTDYKYENEYAQENYSYYYSKFGSITLELSENSNFSTPTYCLVLSAEKSKKSR